MKILVCTILLISGPVFAQDGGEPPAQAEEAAQVEEAAPAEAPAEEAEAPAEEAPPEEEEVKAEEVSEDSEAVADSASLIAQAIQDKNWALLAGILLSLLVAFANRFGLKDKVGGKAVPWVTSGVAVAGAISAALLVGIPILEALSQGLLAGVAAIGGWEMLLKHVLAPKKSEEPAA
jgi:hypothetical protein